ncbi:MAG: hypothetical protein GQ534_06740 [Candidatus Delongbacteria bacterium]|nr:hypothetical protein [Candidatus Delongbacteria bacterium]
MPVNTAPKLMIYDTSDIISNKETRVQWYGNDVDGTSMTYFYCLTTDTTLTVDNAAATFAGLWNETSDSYVDISMPFAVKNASLMFIDSTTYIDSVEAIEVQREIVWSKFFIYGVDEEEGQTSIVSKLFGRTNKIPKHPMVNSKKLDVNGFDAYWFTIGPDSATMVLAQETSFWKPIDFRWMGEDPDGPEVDLEFRWELWEIDTLNMQPIDVVMIDESNGWSISYLSVEFASTIYNHKDDGRYSFRVWVRDDALEESENHATVNFEVFAPQLNRGILYVDDTDDNMYLDPSYLKNTGNPDGVEVNAMYEQFLVDAGYDSTATDLLQDYDVYEFTVPSSDELYQPSLKVLSQYRLVILATEDRSRSTGIDYARYKEQLINYMNIGGKVFVIGHSGILLNDLYVNSYEEPVRDIFNNPGSLMNFDMLSFFYDYFGIYSYSTGESKTHFAQVLYDLGHPLNPSDFYLTDNYDFVGTTVYDHIDDARITPLKVDNVQVNKFWKDYVTVLGPYTVTFDLALKENGTVLTGMPVFEAFKGEIVLKYQSIYDLPYEAGSDSSTVDEGGVVHALDWYNPASDATENLMGPVLQKSGAIATRYVSDGDVFRTAYIGFPLVFMDNSEGQVSDLFSAMIDWFELENNPLEK